jgi:hypothetical protein
VTRTVRNASSHGLLLVEKITANFDQKLVTWELKRVHFKKVIENLGVPAVENLLGKDFEPFLL